ncbi:MAG TPA: hypothetical protein VF929_07465, partial [Gemmatimonadaceae bacterium]
MRQFQRWTKMLFAGAIVLACSSSTGSNGRIDVTPSPLATAARGATVQFTATAYGSNGTPLSPQPTFTWASTNTTVANIASTGVQTAAATMLPMLNLGTGANGQGTCTQISASANGATGQTYLAV